MGKKIDQLDVYDDVNTDKSRKNLFEVSKNTGTYSSPFYDTDGSRKITQEQLREELNIKEYLVNEVIGKTNGDTLEVDKINVLNLTSNATFTLPTASIAYKGKALIIIQSNVNNYKAVINGAAQGPITISDFRDVIIFNCVFNETSTYDWFAISKDDSKICNRLVVISSSTYTANANDNIQANAQSLGSDIDITIPAAGIEGRLIYVYYPSGSPSAYVVNLIGGFSATLEQLDYFLIRDNGSYWEAISTSQNVSTTPSLDEVTDVGNTTQNSIEVGGLVVDMPSGSGAATSITKGGAGEALTVSKTSGSGNVASFTGGVTSIQEAEITSATANRPAFFDSAKKLVIATGALLGTWFQTLNAKSTPIGADTIVVNDSAASFEAKKTTLTELWTNYLRAFVFSATLTTNRVPKSNGSGILADSNITDNGTTITLGTNTSINGNITMPINGQIDVTGNYLQLGANTSTTGVLIGRSGGDMLFNGTTGGLNFNNGGGINNTANQINYRSSLSVDNGKTDGTTYTQHRGEQCFRHSIVLSPNTQLSPNAACSIDLQVTTKGTGLNLVPNASKPTGRKGNFLMNDTNSVLEFTTGTGSNWQELAVYKFDELLQITDCNATFATANTGVYFPFVPKCDMNVTKIYYNLQSAGTDTVRVAIYSDSSNTPTTLLVQSSEATTGSTTLGQRSITIASTRLLAQTRYWIAIKNDSGASSFLSKNNVYSNNITREGFTSGAFVGSPAPSSAVNAIWVGIGI